MQGNSPFNFSTLQDEFLEYFRFFKRIQSKTLKITPFYALCIASKIEQSS